MAKLERKIAIVTGASSGMPGSFPIPGITRVFSSLRFAKQQLDSSPLRDSRPQPYHKQADTNCEIASLIDSGA